MEKRKSSFDIKINNLSIKPNNNLKENLFKYFEFGQLTGVGNFYLI